MYADGRPELDDSSDSDVDYDHNNEDGVGYDSEKDACVFEVEHEVPPPRGIPGPPNLIKITKIRRRTSPK